MADAIIPKAALVTGGCGFIPSNFINHIFEKWPTTTIINLDKLMLCANACNVDKNVRDSGRYRLFIGDQQNEALVNKILNEFNIDTVINFAANSHVDDCYRDPIGSTRNNVLGMTHFLETCRQYNKLNLFIHISSDEVYGDSGLEADEVPKPEHTLLTPTNPYAASKAACEAILNAYRISYKVPALTLRMNNVYGPRQWETKVVPRFIREALEGTPYTIMGGGEQLRSWMYVEDCVNGIRMLCERGTIGDIYNLGTHFELNIIELAKAIHSEVTKQAHHEVAPFSMVAIPDRPYNDKRYFIDTTKIEQEVGWKCHIDFSEGLRRTVAWYMRPQRELVQEKVLVYGGKGWVGRQFVHLMQAEKVPFSLAQSRPGDHADEAVEAELINEAPSHVICMIGRTHGPGSNTIEYLEGGPDKLKENAQDNLYGPWLLATLCEKLGIHMTYIGTGCIYQYDESHPIAGSGYMEEDEPNYVGNSYSVVKGYTDRVMHHFENVFNARIRLPVNFEPDNRNLVVKVAGYKRLYDVPNSLTVLPDMLPIILDLMKKRFTGTLNMTNPGAIKHSDTLAMYKQLVDASIKYDIITDDQPEAEQMRSSRANCTLDTTKLQSMYPHLRTAKEGIREALLQVAHKMGKITEAQLTTHGYSPISC